MKRLVWSTLVLATSWRAVGHTNAFPVFSDETARDYLEHFNVEFREEAKTNSEACWLLARLQSELGRKEEAERLARASLTLDPGRAEVHQFLASLLIRRDELDAAASELRAAVQRDPAISPGYSQLGMVLDRLGDRKSAREAFSKAIKLRPQNGTTRLLLGRLLLDEGELDQAMTQLEEACRLEPLSPNACYALFQARQKHGDKAAAEEAFRRFQELKSREESKIDSQNAAFDSSKDLRAVTASFHVAAAALLGRKGEEAAAEEHLVQATRVGPTETKAYELLVQMFLKRGRLAEAKPMMEALTRLCPGEATYGVNLGTLLLKLHDGPGAVSEFERVLASNPDEPAALNNLARHYLAVRTKLPEALRLSQRLVRTDPKAGNYDLLGWALYANGRTNDAAVACGEAVRRDPQNATFQAHFARIRQMATTQP